MTQQQNETVEHFKRSFLPQLEAYAAKLRHEFPDLWINVDSDPVGSLTSYQAHDVYIECITFTLNAYFQTHLTISLTI